MQSPPGSIIKLSLMIFCGLFGLTFLGTRGGPPEVEEVLWDMLLPFAFISLLIAAGARDQQDKEKKQQEENRQRQMLDQYLEKTEWDAKAHSEAIDKLPDNDRRKRAYILTIKDLEESGPQAYDVFDGYGEIKRDQMIEHVKLGDALGKKIIALTLEQKRAYKQLPHNW